MPITLCDSLSWRAMNNALLRALLRRVCPTLLADAAFSRFAGLLS
jgi:hypothetical protein